MLNKHNTNTELRLLRVVEDCGQKPVALFDIDEVLWNINHSYLEELGKHVGRTFRLEDLTDFDICKTFGVSYDDFSHVLHNTDAFTRIRLCQFAQELVEGIRSGSMCHHFGFVAEPHHVVFITHRGFRPDGFSITHSLLKNNNLLPDTLIAAPLGLSKLEIADDLYGERIVGVFEDSTNTLNEFLAAGIPAIKSLRPWNKSTWTDYTVDLNRSPLPIL